MKQMTKNIKSTTIIVPIKPFFSQATLNGSRKYLLRRKAPSSFVDTIILYESAPTQKIVGFLKVATPFKMNHEQAYDLFKKTNQMTFKQFQTYALHYPVLTVYPILECKRFKEPLKLADFKIFSTLRSFRYVYFNLEYLTDKKILV